MFSAYLLRNSESSPARDGTLVARSLRLIRAESIWSMVMFLSPFKRLIPRRFAFPTSFSFSNVIFNDDKIRS